MIKPPVFDEANHTYYHPDFSTIELPSVTQILSLLDNSDLASLNPSVLKTASNRGTIVHELCQMIDLGCELEDLELAPELAGYVKAYMDFKRDYKPEWELVEQALFDDNGKNFAVPYAGTLDRFGTIDGYPTIVDIKTTSTIGHKQRIKYACQLAAYEELIHANFTDLPDDLDKLILQLKPDGTYRVISGNEIFFKDCVYKSGYIGHLFGSEPNTNPAEPLKIFHVLRDLYYLLN